MDFNEYQRLSRLTALYPNQGSNYIYPTLGLCGESGEVSEKIKKVIRDRKGQIDEGIRSEIAKELGDVLWYMAQLATELGLSLDDVACANIEKLASRKQRNMIHGSGDNR
ncbi:MAG: nucleoside triphosphate pyrophosphohydrolase family protein [SAR324 cluster bacterium]|uniref:Nucleoside triphosphate pyrophosphohydrolase family protein n=1 Tax=SAR324 cluster bacterium TaxID=2024889 RepID=A0A7X9IJX1_9DELT|nr:nucleoside triphosphate pyrophosphohydrolase family protein [SAR324 cluster bacterium]